MLKLFKTVGIVLSVLITISVIVSVFLILRLKISVPDAIGQTKSDTVLRDITYKTADGRNLRLDIYMPIKKIFTSAPAIFVFHGGSWDSGSKDLDEDEVTRTLLSFGAAIVSVEYRLTDSETVFPAHIEDCADSVRFMALHAAEYGIDGDRMCVMGASAGGQLALLLALAGENYSADKTAVGEPLPIQCAVSLCGPTDFVNLEGYNDEECAEVTELLENLFGGSVKEKHELYAEASPINHIRPDACPIFLAHGMKDNIVQFTQAETFYKAAKEQKMNITYVPVQNADHKFRAVGGEITPSIEEILQKLSVFLVLNLIFA